MFFWRSLRCPVLAVIALITSTAWSQEAATMTSDELQIAIQGICPVSGLELGAHGPPVKAKIGEQELFLCCQGCMKRKVKKEHWATIHGSFAKAQGVCVVMENKLPKKPEWTIVNGRVYFVCCPPCIEKIKEEPDTFSKRLDEMYAQYLAKRDE